MSSGPEKPRESTPNFMRKRFYKDVAVARSDNGFQLLLDGRRVRTPAKNELDLPFDMLAQSIAEEWRSQQDLIDPSTMPLTKLANTAIDGVAPNAAEVRSDIVSYAGSDLLCYRADGPHELVRRQAAAWDPVLAAIENSIGEKFVITTGIMPAEQPAETLAKVAGWVDRHEAFALCALHVITSVSGSCILAMAHAEGNIEIDALWSAASIDEDYQMEVWGRDDEALQARHRRYNELAGAAALLRLLGSNAIQPNDP